MNSEPQLIAQREKLRNHLSGFDGKRVMVLGDIMLDEYVWGEVNRISPEAPVPVVNAQRRGYVPGGAANVAANIAALGGDVVLVSVVGADEQAHILREAVQQRGVNPSTIVIDTQRPTTTKTRVVAHSQQMLRIDNELRTPIDEQTENMLLKQIRANLTGVKACVISDYAKGVVTPKLTQALIDAVHAQAARVVVDPKGSNYSKYRGADIVTPNALEAEQASGIVINSETSLQAAATQLLKTLSGSTILITRGAEGMTLFSTDQEPFHAPTAARHVYDVTGAGDTVVGTLALGLAASLSIREAIIIANIAAGLVVGKVGTATISLGELQSAV